MVRTPDSGPKGRGFESCPGHVVISLGKIFTMNFLGLSSVIVTRCDLKKGTSLNYMCGSTLKNVESPKEKKSKKNYEYVTYVGFDCGF